jgi:hypothetical protein
MFFEKLAAVRTAMNDLWSSADGEQSVILAKLQEMVSQAPVAVAGKSKGGRAPKAEKAAKKPRANAGESTAWSEFSSQKRQDHKEVCDAWVEARVAAAKAGELFYAASDAAVKNGRAKAGEPIPENKAKVGAHLTWVSVTYKGADQSEWKAFEAAWKEAHPKGSRAASVADDASEAGSAEASDAAQEKPAKSGKRGAKKYADMTPEELEAAKAKRAANKAKKTAEKEESEAEERQSACMEPASPTHAPSAAIGGGGSVAAAAPAADAEEEPEDSLISFTLKKTKYLRFGHRDENGAPVWDIDGDIWLQTDKGGKGAYAGKLKADGSIDNSPEVLEDEPEME